MPQKKTIIKRLTDLLSVLGMALVIGLALRNLVIGAIAGILLFGLSGGSLLWGALAGAGVGVLFLLSELFLDEDDLPLFGSQPQGTTTELDPQYPLAAGEIGRQIVIRRSLPVVFAEVLDFERHGEWSCEVGLRIRHLSGDRQQVGARFQRQATEIGASETSILQITEIIPHQKITYTQASTDSKPIKIIGGYFCFAATTEGTQVAAVLQFKTSPGFGVVERLYEPGIHQDLINLKERLEA
ncbi:MAG: SRPBCC family protein [Cyanobacteria bacterium P01_G01_bin.54]